MPAQASTAPSPRPTPKRGCRLVLPSIAPISNQPSFQSCVDHAAASLCRSSAIIFRPRGQHPSGVILRGCDFFVRLSWFAVIRDGMSDARAGAVPEAAGEVRLRRPERRQMAWVAQCPDDLVPAGARRAHGGGWWWRSWICRPFSEPIQAREGVAGRDATDPELLVALWLYACIRGSGRRGSWRGAARRACRSAGCAAG